jgi:alkanesulfonate monooxygenase SsuD/methylene tetrahydromethanopterin reductase-like flavin-dependent oxidoreductase (luciferase family)
MSLLVGGDGPRSMRRALEFEAAWAPGQGTIDELRAKMDTLRTLSAEAGRQCPRVVARWLVHPVAPGAERPPIPHSGELRRPRLEPAEAREQIAEIRELGVDEVIIDIPASKATYAANMEFAASLISS